MPFASGNNMDFCYTVAMEKDVQANTAGSLFTDAKSIIDAAKTQAYRSINSALVQRNWLLGKRIAEEELKGGGRAEYGKGIMTELSRRLTAEYGKGFEFRNLYSFLSFYREYPILQSLIAKSGFVLPWTHYRELLQVEDAEANFRVLR